MESTGKIFEVIPLIMSEIEAISKDRKNEKQGYKFRGIDDVLNEIHPLLAKHKVFVTTDILKDVREERKSNNGGTLIYSILDIKHTFYTVDGSWVSVTTRGEGMDSGDKASNKAMSVAFKYACIFIFAIPTEDDKDPENDSPIIAPKECNKKDTTPNGVYKKVDTKPNIVSERRVALNTTLLGFIKEGKITSEYVNELKKKHYNKLDVSDDELEQIVEMIKEDIKGV